jgi:hypothetical protein
MIVLIHLEEIYRALARQIRSQIAWPKCPPGGLVRLNPRLVSGERVISFEVNRSKEFKDEK